MIPVFKKVVKGEEGEKEADDKGGDGLQEIGGLVEEKGADLLNILEEKIEWVCLGEIHILLQPFQSPFEQGEFPDPVQIGLQPARFNHLFQVMVKIDHFIGQ